MKIKKLIELLKQYNPDADITLTTSEDITLSFICKGKNGEILSPRTTMQVFVEPCDECPSCSHNYMNGDDRWCSYYDKGCDDVSECYQWENWTDD